MNEKGMHMRLIGIVGLLGFLLATMRPSAAIDSDASRDTLAGLQCVSVVVEDLQPNIQKYAQRVGLLKDQIRTELESKLSGEGTRVLSYDAWLKST